MGGVVYLHFFLFLALFFSIFSLFYCAQLLDLQISKMFVLLTFGGAVRETSGKFIGYLRRS